MQLINDNSNFFVKPLSYIKAVIISALVIFISCEDKNNILITEKEVKTNNGLYELSLKIDPDIVYSNSSTKVITTIRRLVPGTKPTGDWFCNYGVVGGQFDHHSNVYSYLDAYGVIQFSDKYVYVSLADSANSVWQGLSYFIPTLPLKATGHISANFEGLSLSLPIKLVQAPSN